ncbi:hypothetical protein ACFPK1_18885 [Actinomycetospora rhizophila]|uniref:Uncharacterized protein n=1 Tax=Actinomycetospora rhizophila TaxID=1416876 RepID=A0ABV9ZFI7_9PSEU
MVKVEKRNASQPIEHGSANNVQVINGILYVLINNTNNIVAVYNSEEWENAVVE